MICKLQDLEQAILNYNGTMSVLFPLIKDKFMEEIMTNSKSGLHDGEENFMHEFCCFEDEYYSIKKDIILNHLTTIPVIDIGCQFGLQSEIFLDMEYTGIEAMEKVFLNNSCDNINYISDIFPNKEMDLSGKIAMAIMSLGYFDYAEDLETIQELSKAEIVYCTSTPEFIAKLKNKFKFCKLLNPTNVKKTRISSGVWKFSNHEI
ncbi:hypothetical protein [Faecalibacillus faecis]|uniref:hypothetical protein n=1 Tax=Faecalibacillus faecis TaxID=1982628 RepID=UPI003868411F